MANGGQLRRRRVVVIPQVVMDHLKMPQAFAGACIQREQAIAEEIGAGPVRAVEVERGGAGGEVGDAALLVDA